MTNRSEPNSRPWPPISDADWRDVEAMLDAKFGPLLEYQLEAVCPGRELELPIYATTTSDALKTFDAAFMLWHNERRLYPSIVFAGSVCPDATELVLWHPDGGEIARHRLHAESDRRSTQ